MPSSAPQPQSIPKVIVPRQNGLTRNPERPSVTYSLSFIDVDPVFGMNYPSRCTCLDVRPLAKVTQRGGAATKNMCALQKLRWLVVKGTQRSPRLFTILSMLNTEKRDENARVLPPLRRLIVQGTSVKKVISPCYHRNFRLNCTCLEEVDVLVIVPAAGDWTGTVWFGEGSSTSVMRLGVLKLARLRRLKISARNWRFKLSKMRVSFSTEKSHVASPGPIYLSLPTFPKKPLLFGGATKALGSNHCFGFP